MLKRLQLDRLEQYFQSLSERRSMGVYVCRIAQYSGEIEKFLLQYVKQALKSGVCINGKIQNPTENQLSYFDEILGRNLLVDTAFFEKTLEKWLPRVNASLRNDLAIAMHEVLSEYEARGKTGNMLLNAYTKFMCWFYYKFEPVLLQIGSDMPPKIIYEGSVSEYELKMLYMLAKAGCDVVLLETEGDDRYLKIDGNETYSQLIREGNEKFPAYFSVSAIKEKLIEISNIPVINLEPVKKTLNTNAWINGNPMEDSLKKQIQRGSGSDCYFNMFVGMWGTEDKNTYYNDLLKWKIKLEDTGRKVHIIENGITMPDYSEVSKIKRNRYSNAMQIIYDMREQISVSALDVKAYARNAFAAVLKEDTEIGIQKFLNKAIVLVCWMNKFVPRLFKNGMEEELNTLIYYGQCDNTNEELFLRILARMPIDIVIVNPDLSRKSQITDSLFFEKKQEGSLPKEKFPTSFEELRFGTVAYHAEQDLHSLLYQDTGLYRSNQFKRAISVTLQTTYEEIGIYWNQEALYRPNFETFDDRVMVPVIFTKIAGIPGDIDDYWYDIAKMQNEDTFTINSLPYIKNDWNNPFNDKIHNYFRNGRLLISKIKSSSAYQYAFIREEMQDYMLDKLQQLIDRKIIAGTGTNGTEYVIIATLLNLDKSILRLIQKYDFTKSIPKLMIIHTDESECTIQDSIVAAYLNLIGFDIALFVPTGYRSIERFFVENVMLEHQAGEYKYDLTVPDLQQVKRRRESLAGKIFKRGR